MKILFLMDSPEYLRFYDSAVEEIVARGHTVAIAVSNQREKKPVGLEGLRAYADRVSMLGVVPQREGVWSEVARSIRATMDFVRFLHPTLAAATALRARVKRKVLPRVYHWIDAIPRLDAVTVRRLHRILMAGERAIPVCPRIVQLLREQAPDVLLVSPLVTAASEQVDWIRAARACGIRTAVCIASWDNLTNKGLMRVEPDLVLVWNETQRREAEEYHYIPPQKIAVTGAQLFDRWFERTMTCDREAFSRRVGLPDSGPFVLFTGSSSFISESGAEVAFVRRWVQALRASGDPALQAVRVLVRPHPYNVHRWADDPVADLPGVSVFPRRGYNPIDPENRNDFFDSLYHCAAVVGINTSAMIEAAILGRPVCTLLAEEFSGTQEGTIHFHYLRPERGGFLRIAATVEEHVRQLGECLRDPETTRAEDARFVASFIRPHGTDRPATPVFADAVLRLGHAPAPVPERPPATRHLTRPLLLAAALPALVDGWASDRAAWARARKRAGSLGRRARKRVVRAGARWRRYFDQAW
ncbi:MAG: hypothetical protein HY657_06425 [Acidobacteria bacterium]|nr:hypothetical protein [Acidobacteriota bacterium]